MTAKTDERCLADPRFWLMYLPLFRNEEKVIEFSEVSGIPAGHIRQARDDYLRKVHEGTRTIN